MNIKDLTRELVSRNTEEAKSFALGYLSKLNCECSEFCGGVIAVKKGRSDFNIMRNLSCCDLDRRKGLFEGGKIGRSRPAYS